MGAGRIGEIARRLIAGGRAPTTPVAAVRNGTRPDQETVRATLATIAEAGVHAPSAIVVGDVAGLDLRWFEARPLFGRSVVVTRAREQASELRGRLEALGADVIELPAIAIEPVDVAVPDLGAYEWVVFTSANGVRAFFERGLAAVALDTRAFAGVRVAAIGPGTARELSARGLRADLLPERFVAESLLEAFPPPGTGGARVLIARAEHARDVLPDGLGARGYVVDVLPVYRTVRATPDPAAVARGPRRESGRDHVHVVVHRRQPLRGRGSAARPSTTRGVDRPGDLGDRGRPRPARRRRSHRPHHRRRRRHAPRPSRRGPRVVVTGVAPNRVTGSIGA